jgi:hypothetical protein
MRSNLKAKQYSENITGSFYFRRARTPTTSGNLIFFENNLLEMNKNRLYYNNFFNVFQVIPVQRWHFDCGGPTSATFTHPRKQKAITNYVCIMHTLVCTNNVNFKDSGSLFSRMRTLVLHFVNTVFEKLNLLLSFLP